MNVTQHDAHLAIQRLWKSLPVGVARDFNIVVSRLENLEAERYGREQ